MTFKKSLLLNLVLGIIPGYALYVFIYSFTHQTAIWKFSKHGGGLIYSGIDLKITGLIALILYLSFLASLSYKQTTKGSFYQRCLNKSVWISGLIASLGYLPLVAFLNSGVNKW